MTQIRRQAGWWNQIILSTIPLLLRPVTLLLVALVVSSFSMVYNIIHLPNDDEHQQSSSLRLNNRSSRGSKEDPNPRFRRNKNPSRSKKKNPLQTALVDHDDSSTNTNNMVKIDAKLSAMNPLDVWESLLKSSSSKKKEQKKKQTVIEVGVHSPKQCINAAELGYDTHCFEPSPPSYTRIERGVHKTPPKTRDLVHIYNTAVGDTSGQTIPFHSTGGTGDHVGDVDMWQMKRQFVSRSDVDRRKRGTVVQVPTVRLDDFIAGDSIVGDNEVFLLKVDTQGFEPSIFLGLETTIKGASVDYIIFEFWPRGMDLLSDTSNECIGHKILDQLIAAGYTLYALKVESHPKALKLQSLNAEARTRPFTVGSTKEYCEWFFNLEEKYPSKTGEEQYKFGYWSDFLAVAPGVKLPDEMNDIQRA
eukprot:CAMPEP_0201726376 /NCGR_PEP_ID=MMETSP0593-20130828/9412_1 /ASSEMBLY_ACC=CAM_ASM_000672 /TAXON_ID=267983 /ORGANISM="Skeletonema japonicum, Strain CCMP2506" /LENGTH=416 /DNA_ID=CAMNT_0048217851 /DNA_START=32 /DNA_END=1283 /DNA_ORIENTATION=-